MKRWITKLTVLVVGVLMTSTFAFAGEIGKVTAIEGKVDILQPGQSVARPAEEGAVISIGDIIRTKNASKAEITFTDNTVVNLAEKTRVEIKDYRLDPQKKRIGAVLNIERGKIRATVSKSAAKDSFIVNTPNASGSVKGTDLYIIYQKSSTGVVVLDGKLSVANSSLPDKSIEITSGNTTVISSDQPPTATRAILAMEKKSHEADTQITKAREEKPFSAEGYSSPEDMTAIVVKVSGSARIRSRGALTWYDAKINDGLNAGDVIETKDDGKIEIKLENGNVINLKPNSELKLQKLSKDLKTGDYENLLESSRGKLRAQVQKLKGNSKFEVKTPTAVACVRGTVLFLNILPNMTTAYFENGNGTVQNLVSGTIQIVAAGNSSSADDQGNVSPPAPPSDEQQSEWQEGWESEGGGEGYSAPGVDTGGKDTGGEDAVGTDLGSGTDNPPFDDVPFTDKADLDGDNDDDTGDTIAAEDTLPPTLQANFTGLFGNYGSFQEDGDSSFSATLTSYTDAVTITPWPFIPVPEDFTIAGTYSNPNGRHLWFGEVPGIQVGDNALLGWVGGSWGSWEGALSFIYIDSSGTAGHLFGYMSGPTDDSTGTFSGDGDLYIIPRNAIDLSPQNLSDSIVNGSGGGELYVSFNDGYLDTEFYRETKKIEGENWGIWREIHRGTYDRPDELPLDRDGLPHWIGVAGGNYNNGGYFFSAYKGIDNLDDLLRIDVFGTYLDYEKLGAYYGTILGAYTPSTSFDFEGVGLGGFEEETLTFSGYWGTDSLYYNDGGYIEWAGEDWGLVGSATAQWWNEASFPVVAMGKYWDEYGSGPYIWNTPIQSYNAAEYNSTTLDGGAFYGFTGGIWNNGMMNGAAAAIYLSPTETEGIYNAGVLRGDMKGNYYPELEMWMADGALTPTQMATGLEIDPEDTSNYIDYGYIKGYADGYFADGDSYIEGWDNDNWGETYFIYGDGDSQPWGIYDLKLGYENAYSNPANSPIWFATLDGYGEFGYEGGDWYGLSGGIWKDGEIRGPLRGLYVTEEYMSGIIKGDVFGIYEEDGDTWIGESLGVFTEMGPVNEDWIINESEFYGTGLGSFENGGMLEALNIEGMALDISEQKWGIWSAFFEGNYSEPDSSFRLAAAGSHNGMAELDGYWLGSLSGNWNNGVLIGNMRGVFFDPQFDQDDNLTTFNAGSVTGDVIGVYDVDTTWQAAGVGDWIELAELDPSVLGFDNVALAEMVSVPITETYSALLQGTGTFDVGGAINATMDISMYASASDALSGIWAALINGNYTGPTSDSWSVAVDNGNVNLTGSQWNNGQWLADVSGTVSNAAITGQAGGTYTDPNPDTGVGALTGVGAGTWTQGSQ